MEKIEKQIVYLLGAGFSQAMTDDRAPSTKKLREEIGNICPEKIKNQYNFSAQDIELFLTKIDTELLDSGNNHNELVNFRAEVNDKIVELCATAKMGGITPAANDITRMLFKRNNVVLTLNYDCYLEYILWSQKRWHTFGGWGRLFKFPHDVENAKLDNIEIFKLHGSINFELVGNGDLRWKVNKEIFPNSNEDTSYIGGVKEYFILPSYIKAFHKRMLALFKEAALALNRADKLVIMGASLRKEDFHLFSLLSFVNRNTKIIIIDKDAETISLGLIDSMPVNPANIEPIPIDIKDINNKLADKIYS